MLGEDHNLYHEFPEYESRIHELQQADGQFADMASRYHSLDKEIRGLEMREVPTSDYHFENLKKERAFLKDRLYDKLAFGEDIPRSMTASSG